MGVPDSAIDRWLVREGWYFLRWTVNRDMVRSHDTVGTWLLSASPFAALALGTLVEPMAAAVGLSLAVIGGVHLGISKWVKAHPEVRDTFAPPLSRQARRFLQRLVRPVVGTDTLGQKYYGKILKPSADQARATARDHMNADAFAVFERLATAYNRFAGLVARHPEVLAPIDRAALLAVSEGIERVAELDAYPERHAEISPAVNRIADQLLSLNVAVEAQLSAPQLPRDEDLRAWLEVLGAKDVALSTAPVHSRS